MIQLLWLTLLAVHTGAAAVWWWIMPGGFPSSATAYWVNEFFPPIVMAMFLVALLARGKLSQAILPPILAIIPIFWMAFGISARLIFFESWRSLWNLPFLAGAALAGLWARQFRFKVKPVWLVPVLAVLAAWAGWSLPPTQRSPDPSTTPAGAAFTAGAEGSSDHKLVKLTRDAQLRPGDGRVVIRRDKLILNVMPMLTFADRSPDRCSISMAPEGMSTPTTRTLTQKTHDGAHWTLVYKDEDQSLVDVSTANNAIQIDSRSRIGKPIFSHQNSFAELTVQGHKKLAVSFSPAPQQKIEVTSATAPARFAYLDERGVFHVMQASREKRGPYRELASGPLDKSKPLTLTIYDADKPAFVVALDDWAQQASTQLSPTAGDGIPMNAIELVRGGDDPATPALISFSLASTAIGRGDATVGHTAGVYRDRMEVSLP